MRSSFSWCLELRSSRHSHGARLPPAAVANTIFVEDNDTRHLQQSPHNLLMTITTGKHNRRVTPPPPQEVLPIFLLNSTQFHSDPGHRMCREYPNRAPQGHSNQVPPSPHSSTYPGQGQQYPVLSLIYLIFLNNALKKLPPLVPEHGYILAPLIHNFPWAGDSTSAPHPV